MMTTASLPCRAGLALGLALAASTIASAKGLSGHLHGSEWGFVGDPAGAERFVQFTGGKRLVGSGGCNRYSGNVSTGGEALRIGPLRSTRMACAPELMQQETAFLRALESATSARREGDRLELRTATGALAVTARAAARP